MIAKTTALFYIMAQALEMGRAARDQTCDDPARGHAAGVRNLRVSIGGRYQGAGAGVGGDRSNRPSLLDPARRPLRLRLHSLQ